MAPKKATLAELLDRPTVDVGDAARILNVSRGAAYAAAREGRLPVLRFGRRMVVPTAALRRMLELDPPAERAS